MKHAYNICTIDTETVGGATKPKGMYNLGFVIFEMHTGRVLTQFDIIIDEFYNQIKDDDYAKKNFELYAKRVGASRVLHFPTEQRAINFCRKMCRLFNVKYISAYNSGFDFCKTKCRLLLNEFEFIDIYLMALQTVTHLKKYRAFCIEHNYLSRNKKKCATSAESVYAFITNDGNYVEEHTALADALIEKEIFARCLSMHKKYSKNCHAWDCPDYKTKCYPKV